MKILFIDGTKGFAPDRLNSRPTGGILTSLTLIPRHLADRGNDVYVVSHFDQETSVRGVHYIQNLNGLVPDVVVFNRNSIDRPTAEHFKRLNPNCRIVWWLHDIVDHRYLQDDGYRLANTIVALSDYCRRSYADFYDLPMSKFVIIPNGVDKNVFFPPEIGSRRNKNLYLCASAPIKGTYPIPFTFHQLRRFDTEMELRMYSSQKLHDLEDTSFISRDLASLREAGVNVVEPIPQSRLADVFREAWALLMPNHYPEICSNVLLQAQACGLPVVASNIGSVSEFIKAGETGLLTHTFPHDMFLWWKDFAELAVKLRANEAFHTHLSMNSPCAVRSWDEIGALWTELLTSTEVPA
jgi:glycosyltransferase involved in cell wall biosynthesis